MDMAIHCARMISDYRWLIFTIFDQWKPILEWIFFDPFNFWPQCSVMVHLNPVFFILRPGCVAIVCIQNDY
jgi:hypothetical protein